MFYELLIDLGTRSDARLLAALARLWQHETLRGPFADSDLSEEVPLEEGVRPGSHLYGEGRLPNGSLSVVGSVRLESDDGDDFIFYISMDSLEEIYEAIHEPGPSWELWEPEVSEWLARIGRWVYEEVPFSIALIGGEPAPGFVPRPVRSPQEIPGRRGVGYLLPDETGDLCWFPINFWG